MERLVIFHAVLNVFEPRKCHYLTLCPEAEKSEIYPEMLEPLSKLCYFLISTNVEAN